MGLYDIGSNSNPNSIFSINGTLYMLATQYAYRWPPSIHGFNWTESVWQVDNDIKNGINVNMGSGQDGYWNEVSATIFKMNGTLYFIAGDDGGNIFAYNWTGITWQADTNIILGIDYNNWLRPDVIQFNSIWYLITSGPDNNFIAYTWNGSTWQNDLTFVKELSKSGYQDVTLFQKGTDLYLLSSGYASDGTYGASLKYTTNYTMITNATAYYNVTSIKDGEHTYYVTCEDIFGRKYKSDINSLTVDTTRTIPPKWSDNKTSVFNLKRGKRSVHFNITLTDDYGAGHYIFSFNDGTGWTNDSTASWINNTEIEIIKTVFRKNNKGRMVQGFLWFNDSKGTINMTDTWSVAVNSIPVRSV